MELKGFLIPERSGVGKRLLEDPRWVRFLARFILTRPYQSKYDSETHFPNLIHGVVNKIIENKKESGDAERLRDSYVNKLCAFMQGATWNLALDTQSNGDIFRRVLFIAAIYFNDTRLVDSLIERPRKRFRADILCSPLHAAVCTDNFDLMQRLMKLGETWDCKGHRIEGRSVLDEVVQRPDLGNAMNMLSGQGTAFTSMWGTCNIHDCWIATCTAIELKKFDVAYKLSDMGWERWDFPNRIDIQILVFKALVEASKERQFGLIRKILDTECFFVPTRFGRYKRVHLWLKACEEGEKPLLCILLERSLLINAQAPWVDEFLNASIAGDTSIGVTLLDQEVETGKAVEDYQALIILKEAAPCAQSFEMIRYLLQWQVIRLDGLYKYRELATCIESAAKYGNHKYLEVLASYGVPLGERSFYTSFNCPPPIIAAKAFRQTETVRELLRLGVPDADPLDSIFAQQFASGEYPCDPQPCHFSHNRHIETMVEELEIQKKFSWIPYQAYMNHNQTGILYESW